ncbi:cell division protein PerM [Cryptosporangium minutisporangium]|uniref:cell division protein PerM n=1 Tax=Cryptosporangium minutisporangium TaxID=113569 RepID=UPI0031F17F17
MSPGRSPSADRASSAGRAVPGGGVSPARVALPAAAVTTAGWAALVVVGPMAGIALMVWVAENRSGAPAGDALRLATDGWLLAHGVQLQTATGPVGLVPLVLSALVVRQLYRAGRNSALATGAESGLGVARVAIAVGIAYGFLGTVAALVGSTAAVRADPASAGMTTGLVAMFCAGWGAARTAGLGAVVAFRLPYVVRRGLTAGAVAAAAVLTAGVLAAGAQIVVTQEEFRSVFGSLQGGVVGGVAIVALCILYAPTAAVWATAYLIGPGFAVGTGTAVDASTVQLAPLPSFPLLAAVPTGPASAMVSLVLAAPLIAGLLAGVVTARPDGAADDSDPPELPRWRIALGGALIAGPVAGVLVGFAAAASSGPLGRGRLAELGPSPWHVGIVLAVEVAVAALVGATVARTAASWAAWSAGRRWSPAGDASPSWTDRLPPVLRRLGHSLFAGPAAEPRPAERVAAPRPAADPPDDVAATTQPPRRRAGER